MKRWNSIAVAFAVLAMGALAGPAYAYNIDAPTITDPVTSGGGKVTVKGTVRCTGSSWWTPQRFHTYQVKVSVALASGVTISKSTPRTMVPPGPKCSGSTQGWQVTASGATAGAAKVTAVSSTYWLGTVLNDIDASLTKDVVILP